MQQAIRPEIKPEIKPASSTSFPEISQNAAFLLAACGASLLFDEWDVPANWLLAPMLAGIAIALARRSAQPFPVFFSTLGKAIVGVYTAARFSPETIGATIAYAPPLLLCVAVTALLSLANGFFLSRWAKIDLATSLLGSIPGASTAIVAVSEEMGADAVVVSLLQYLRLVLVVVSIPIGAKWIFSSTAIAPGTSTLAPPIAGNSWVSTAIACAFIGACVVSGTWLGRKLRLPVASFLGSFCVAFIALQILPHPGDLPRWPFNAALLFVGLSIGLRFKVEVLPKLIKAIVIDIALIFALILACLGISYEFHVITHVDTMTAVLGLTPGGLEAMLATVAQLGGDVGLVMAMQLTRMFLLLSAISGVAALGLRAGKALPKENPVAKSN